MKTITQQADVTLTQSGDQWLFRPNNERAESWLKDRFKHSAMATWVGGTLVVDGRILNAALIAMNTHSITSD